LIRAVANKRLDLSEDEYSYFLTLKDEFGEAEFRGIFETDRNGIITMVSPPVKNPTSLGILFFLLNVMMNQRLRNVGVSIAELKKNQQNVAEINSVDNILERIEMLERKVRIILETTANV
tara:strand:- start:4347 stop:4706 length:360 start_codon:yes stop_codon:yes gene_type:complete